MSENKINLLGSRMRKIAGKWWPLLVLLLVEGGLVAVNFKPGTYLVGWDNLFPELDFKLNFERSVFGVWQDYRGLGYEDGMSHAANLVHYVFIWILSWVMPTEALRYAGIFWLHWLGGVGMYVLMQYLLARREPVVKQWAGLVAALFYQYAFATIQMFYLPFEVFVTHFGYLPWLLWGVWRFLERGGKRELVVLTGIMILAIPQAHVPTVFLVWVMVLLIVSLVELILNIRRAWRRVALVWLMTFLVNAYWGLPFAVSTIHNAETIANSKNNQMATDDIFIKNHEYGDFKSTALMRSFALEYVQYDHTQDKSGLMMQTWRDFVTRPEIERLYWGLFGVAVGGVALAVWQREKQMLGLVVVGGLVFAIVGNDIPGLGTVSLALRTYVPLFHNVFRFVFTKFFTLYALVMGVFIGYAGAWLLAILMKWRMRWLVLVVGLGMGGLVLGSSLPSFQGYFFHPQLKVVIPDDYFEMFKFFRNQPDDQRIAVLPAPWYWSWTQYKWGVIGSGFQWFGIRQPILDRAFDPWDEDNENFYWEITQALQTAEKRRVEEVFDKYQISWLVVDDHILGANEMLREYLRRILRDSDRFSYAGGRGNIEIYKFETKLKPSNWVSLIDIPVKIGPEYRYTDFDQAYSQYGVYYSSDQVGYEAYYPFRSLFSGKQEADRLFRVYERGEAIVMATTLPEGFEGLELTLPPLSEAELIYKDEENSREGVYYPGVFLDSQMLGSGDSEATAAAQVVSLPEYGQGILEVVVPKVKGAYYYDYSGEKLQTQEERSCDSYNNELYYHEYLEEDGEWFLRLTSENSSNCIGFSFLRLRQDKGYLFMVDTRHIWGRKLVFNLMNQSVWRPTLETKVDYSNNQFEKHYFMIPPMKSDASGLTLYLDNVSYGRVRAVNDVKRVEVMQVPYEFISGLVIKGRGGSSGIDGDGEDQVRVTKKYPFWYEVEYGDISDERLLVLWQGYSPYWVAGESMFSRGAIIESVRVNNWANGWLVPIDNKQLTTNDKHKIIILFWPQWLLFGGGILALVGMSVVFWKKWNK